MIQQVLKNNYFYPISTYNKSDNFKLSLKSLKADTFSFNGNAFPLIADRAEIESIAEQIFDTYEDALNKKDELSAQFNIDYKPNYKRIKPILTPLDVITTSLVLNHLVNILNDNYSDYTEKIDLANMLISVGSLKPFNLDNLDKLTEPKQLDQLKTISQNILKEETILQTALNLYHDSMSELIEKPVIPNINDLEKQYNEKSTKNKLNPNPSSKDDLKELVISMFDTNKILKDILFKYQNAFKDY